MKNIEISLAAPLEYAKRLSPKINNESKTYGCRTKFMRDRDRILFSQAFRKSSGKTQIFPANYGDTTRTRLTHTLEVAQFARTIAKILNLDVDLTEAIALGHDLGHTPFGHVGERTLNLIMNGCDILNVLDEKCPILREGERGFKHNLQSVRVLTHLEQPFKRYPGLDLTNFTLWGIRQHTKLEWKSCIYKETIKDHRGNFNCLRSFPPINCPKNQLEVDFYKQYDKYLKLENSDKPSWSFEAYVVKQCDEIAQRHHDLEDALCADLITDGQIIQEFERYLGDWIDNEVDRDNFAKLKMNKGKKDFPKHLSSFVVTFYLQQLLSYSFDSLRVFIKQNAIHNEGWPKLYQNINLEDVEKMIAFSEDFTKADHSFQQEFLKDVVMNSYRVQRMDGHGSYIIKKLFKAYLDNPEQLPDEVIYQLYKIYDFEYVDSVWNRYNAGDDTMEDDKIIAIIVGQLRNNLVQDRHKFDFRARLSRVICDYISGMTDAHAVKDYEDLYE
ncbi:deoxyguanosinetriphosphate triphosphohydrolase family protein [Pelosinus sp. sgz500959]|uniref:deoxyguanosinetriphosphate triphosphohydrolase family protein n=1 Tax=Pelosinus sp. sgz500959 TaxID=3242472 RepID=UPI00366F428F